MGLGESLPLTILFDPAYKSDYHSRTVDEMLTVSYKEHPHIVSEYPHMKNVKTTHCGRGESLTKFIMFRMNKVKVINIRLQL